jgi:hypothetical protein
VVQKLSVLNLSLPYFFGPAVKSAVSVIGSSGQVYELEIDQEGLLILTVPSTGSSVANILV